MTTPINTPITCPECTGDKLKHAETSEGPDSYACVGCGHVLHPEEIHEITKALSERLFAGFLSGATKG